jgi:hypothetical protein
LRYRETVVVFAHVNQDFSSAKLFEEDTGQLLGKAMGGNDGWGHDGYWYAR